MEAAKSAANEEMQENKHTDYIYMVTGDRLVISMNAELDHHLADEMRDVIDTIIEERGVRHLIFDFSKIHSNRLVSRKGTSCKTGNIRANSGTFRRDSSSFPRSHHCVFLFSKRSEFFFQKND